MMIYDTLDLYAAQMKVILPSLYAPFGLPQSTVTVVSHAALLPPTGVRGWPSGSSLVAAAWRQAAATGYCGHLVVASGAQQSAQSFTFKLGGSFPVNGKGYLGNASWAAMRVVRLFDADYAITLENGCFTDFIDAGGHNVYQLGDCGDKAPPAPGPSCVPAATPLGCFDVSSREALGECNNLTSSKGKHDPNKACLMMAKSSCANISKKLTAAYCAKQCQHWQPKPPTGQHRSYPQIGLLGGAKQSCFCGAYVPNPALSRPLAECQATKCSGNASETCGGVERMTVWNYTVVQGKVPWAPLT